MFKNNCIFATGIQKNHLVLRFKHVESLSVNVVTIPGQYIVCERLWNKH